LRGFSLRGFVRGADPHETYPPLHVMTAPQLTRPLLALLAAIAVGACGKTGDDGTENDSAAVGAGSAQGTSIGQTPGYGAPGAGGAMGDTLAARGPVAPSGGMPSPADSAALRGRADTAGSGTGARAAGAAADTTRGRATTPPRP
jgi:hypothetical protein